MALQRLLTVSVLTSGLLLSGCPEQGSTHKPGDGHDHGPASVHTEGDGHDHKAEEHKEGDGHDHKEGEHKEGDGHDHGKK